MGSHTRTHPSLALPAGTPIVLIVLNDKHAAKMKTVAEEVRARGAYTIVITNNAQLFEHELDASKGVDFDLIKIPSNGPMTNLLSVLPFQVRRPSPFHVNVVHSSSPLSSPPPPPHHTMCLHQLLAYELSVMRKENPDRPRNLAKAVTVD